MVWRVRIEMKFTQSFSVGTGRKRRSTGRFDEFISKFVVIADLVVE